MLNFTVEENRSKQAGKVRRLRMRGCCTGLSFCGDLFCTLLRGLMKELMVIPADHITKLNRTLDEFVKDPSESHYI